MHPTLPHNRFFVREHTGIFKAANNFDSFDRASGQKVLEYREPDLGLFTNLFRFTDYKRMTPFEIRIATPEGQKVLTIRRGISLLLSSVDVLDEHDRVIGHFKQKLFSIGGKFDVLTPEGRTLCTLQGKLTRWDFRFVNGNTELASVTKKWAGLGRELFTSADNYMLSIQDAVPGKDPARLLILAAVMCIDMVLKE